MSQSHNHFNQQYGTNNRQQPQQAPQTLQKQRREFLWRERMKLELQVQALSARSHGLAREWQLLQNKKAGLAQQKPWIAVQILFAGFVGIRHLPSEQLLHTQRARLAQEEYRIQQAFVRCQNDLTALHTQIHAIDSELSFL